MWVIKKGNKLMSTQLLTLTTPSSLSNPYGGSSSCSISDNVLLSIFEQLATDCNSILLSRLQAQVDNAIWTAVNQEIIALVAAANSGVGADQRSLIYGQIMLIITSQYLPAVSNFLGDQIAEQASIQNMASDISAFVIQAQSAFNTLGSSPDCTGTETSTTTSCVGNCCTNDCTSTTSTSGTCNCTSTSLDCTSNYEFFSGIMTMIAGINNTVAPESGPNYSFGFTATVVSPTTGTISSSELNILGFLTDTSIWGTSGTPISSSQYSQISTALIGIATIFNPSTTTANVDPDTWSNGDLSGIASATCSWTQPYGSSSASGTITTGNAPLVYTEPATIQSDLNTAAQTVEGIATSTQTIENFQVQEIDQFYGITNSIQMSQEQQCASMVKQQTT